MIQIKTQPQRDLDQLAKDHFNKLKTKLQAGIPALEIRQQNFINKHLEEIIREKPAELFKLYKAFRQFCRRPGPGQIATENIHNGLSGVFDYNWFTQTRARHYKAYDLAKALKVDTCPYCNRNYTVTVEAGTPVTRADFDHFLPKEAYPLLALSFYNLVPSCLVCNRSIKNQKKVVYGKFIHPYEEGFESGAKFNHLPLDPDSMVGLGNNFDISLTLAGKDVHKDSRSSASFKLFELKAVYEASHGGEIADLIRKHHISGGKYLENLKDTFPKLGKIEELYQLAFGNHYAEDDFCKRPLAKLTKDTVEQLTFTDPFRKIP